MNKEVVKIGRYIEFEHEDGICENMLLLTEKETNAMENQLNKSYEYEQQITQLTNNWNELEEDINNKIKDIKMNFSQVNGNYFNMNYVLDTYEEVLDKMKEIKEGNNVSINHQNE